MKFLDKITHSFIFSNKFSLPFEIFEAMKWAQEYSLLYAFFIHSVPVAATVDLLVSCIGPKWSPSNSKVTIGPIRDTSKNRPQWPFKQQVPLSQTGILYAVKKGINLNIYRTFHRLLLIDIRYLGIYVLCNQVPGGQFPAGASPPPTL